jgi:hypothetical protein
LPGTTGAGLRGCSLTGADSKGFTSFFGTKGSYYLGA